MKPKSCTAMVIGMLFDPAEPDLEGVLLAGLGAGILEAVDVALLVTELQRVDRALPAARHRARLPPSNIRLEALRRARCACGGWSPE